MRVLVTGGSGFIGSHVVDKLRDAGHVPVIYDRLESPHHAAGEVETVLGELDDLTLLESAMAGCGAVMHLAASADVNIVAKEPLDAEACNARGTVTVLEAARRAEVGRVVYASTIWVYTGESGQRVDEESPLGMPNHLYTASKLAGEMYCQSYHELYGLETTTLRFGIPYGPRARPAAVVPAFVEKALKGEALTVAGGGLQSRRFVYVEDLADGIVKALAPAAANRVYNLAGTETVTIKQVAETVQQHVGETEIVHTPGRSGDFAGAEISSARAAEELGWAATTTLDEGVSGYLTWLRETQTAQREAAAEETVGEGVVGVAVAGLCALLGTAIAYLIAARFGLSSGQLHVVALTSLAASLLAMTLSPVHQLRARDLIAAGAIAFTYVLLLAIPATRHGLGLMAPHLSGVLLSAVGAAIAMSSFTAARRWRNADERAPEHAT